MKHRVKLGNSKFIDISYSIFFLILVAIFIYLVTFFLLKILGNDSLLVDLFLGLSGLTIFIVPFLSLCITIGIIGSISPYIRSICNAYTLSIKEALKTEYPHGVVYILGGILEELDKFELDLNPDSKFHEGKRYGFPNKTNLKETVLMAQMLCKEWEQLKVYDQARASQAMGQIRARIQQEDFSLWTNIKPEKGKDIYYFSYGDADYQAEKRLDSYIDRQTESSKEYDTYQEQLDKSDDSQPNQETPYYQNTPQSGLLDFDNWQEKVGDVYGFLSDEQKKEEYQRYVESFKVNNEFSSFYET